VRPRREPQNTANFILRLWCQRDKSTGHYKKSKIKFLKLHVGDIMYDPVNISAITGSLVDLAYNPEPTSLFDVLLHYADPIRDMRITVTHEGPTDDERDMVAGTLHAFDTSGDGTVCLTEAKDGATKALKDLTLEIETETTARDKAYQDWQQLGDDSGAANTARETYERLSRCLGYKQAHKTRLEDLNIYLALFNPPAGSALECH